MTRYTNSKDDEVLMGSGDEIDRFKGRSQDRVTGVIRTSIGSSMKSII